MKRVSSKRLFELAVIFFWASGYCHTPYLTPYLESLGIVSSVIGLIVGTYGFTQMLLRIPLGIATDATGAYKAVTMGGLFFSTLSALGLYLFTDVWLIFLFRALAGVAASAWIAMTVAYMSFFRDEDSVDATAILNKLNCIGKLIAFMLGAVVAERFGYRSTLMMSFIVGMIGLCIIPFVDNIVITRTPASISGFVRCLKNKNTLVAALLASVSMMIVHGTVFSFTSTLAKNVGASATMLSILSIVFTLIPIILTDFLKSDRIKNGSRAKELGFAFALLSIYLVALAFAQSVYVILGAQVLAGIAFALTNSLLMSECVRGVSPGERTTAMGIFQAVYGIGMTIGPIYMGKAREVLGTQNSCLLFAAFVAVVAIIVRVFLFKDSPAKVDKAH